MRWLVASILSEAGFRTSVIQGKLRLENARTFWCVSEKAAALRGSGQARLPLTGSGRIALQK